MIVDFEAGLAQQKRINASAVVVRSNFGDPLVVVIDVNNATVICQAGDPDFPRYLRMAGVKVNDTEIRKLILPTR